ncbi:MAG TPA: hypothetical protein VJN02_08675 [Gammaproteobacteria bacterium]|nr:hypothetical protein [Gammaproteobacteria bacterium]
MAHSIQITKKIISRLFVPVFIILSYLYFVSPSFLPNQFSYTPQTHYQYLTAGFLSGQLNLSISPSKQLINLPNPYDPHQNIGLRLHDASLYHGKYYLYFGALPVFTYFIPFKLLTGLYPSEASAVLFFLALGFMIGFALLIQIKEQHFAHFSELQLIFAGLILGFANNAPFLLTRPKFYEVAIASAFCFMSFSIFFLYNSFHSKFQTRNIFLFSLCLSLTVASRPHFALICIILIPTMLIYFYHHLSFKKTCVLALTILGPPLSIGLLLAAYNYMRFTSVLEFGTTYQLAAINVRETGLTCAQFYQHLPFSFFRYYLQPFSIQSAFPYISFSHFTLAPASPQHQHDLYGRTMGCLLTTPIIVFIFTLASQINFYFVNNVKKLYPLLWFVVFTAFVPIINSSFLMSINGITQRYISDFIPYLVLLAIISVWLLEEYQLKSHLYKIWQTFFIATGTFSILFGINLGSMITLF